MPSSRFEGCLTRLSAMVVVVSLCQKERKVKKVAAVFLSPFNARYGCPVLQSRNQGCIDREREEAMSRCPCQGVCR